MQLLSLPNETLFSIALILWTPPIFHVNDDWRAGLHDATADLSDSDGLVSQISALARVNRRIRRVMLPLRLRTAYLFTRGKLAIIYNRLQDSEKLGNLVQYLVVRRDCVRNSTYGPVIEMISIFRCLTTLHIPDKIQVHLSFFIALSQCKALKHLHLVCSGGGLITSHVLELKSLRLETFFIEVSTIDYPILEDKERLPCLPLVDLLSGDTRRSLQHLTVNTTEFRTYSHRRDLKDPLLAHFIRDDSIYESVQVLQLSNINTTADCLRKYSKQFPKLSTLLMRFPPSLASRPVQVCLPSPRRLYINEFFGDEPVVIFTPSVEQLAIDNDLTPFHFLMLCSDLKAQSPSRLRVLSINVAGIIMVGEDARALSLLFSSIPCLEKLMLSSGDFPKHRWDTCLKYVVTAFTCELKYAVFICIRTDTLLISYWAAPHVGVGRQNRSRKSI